VSGLKPGHYSKLIATNLQPTANQERNDQCGNQHYSRQRLMMGIIVPETGLQFNVFYSKQGGTVYRFQKQ